MNKKAAKAPQKTSKDLWETWQNYCGRLQERYRIFKSANYKGTGD